MMKKHFIFLGVLLLSGFAFSQIGINTTTPKTTMDVSAKRDSGGTITDNTQLIGLQAPRLTRAELTANTATYGADQKGALAYITDVSGGTAVGQRINIDAVGYYYFDGSVWQKFVSSSTLGVPKLVVSAGVPGTQDIKGNAHLVGIFSIEYLDVYNAWTSNVFTVPAGMSGVYIVAMQISNKHTVGGGDGWFTIGRIEKSTDGGATWSTVLQDTSSNNLNADVDNGNKLYWTSTLNENDKIRVGLQSSATTNNIVTWGSVTITQLNNQ